MRWPCTLAYCHLFLSESSRTWSPLRVVHELGWVALTIIKRLLSDRARLASDASSRTRAAVEVPAGGGGGGGECTGAEREAIAAVAAPVACMPAEVKPVCICDSGE
eukprot:scaffold165479_cov35-Tisochrysis_lutea.AAC.4